MRSLEICEVGEVLGRPSIEELRPPPKDGASCAAPPDGTGPACSYGRSRPDFTEEKKCLILADYLEGMPLRLIAQKHGCSKSYPSLLAERSGLYSPRGGRYEKIHRRWRKIVRARSRP